jgi:hypothetical protein
MAEPLDAKSICFQHLKPIQLYIIIVYIIKSVFPHIYIFIYTGYEKDEVVRKSGGGMFTPGSRQ